MQTMINTKAIGSMVKPMEKGRIRIRMGAGTVGHGSMTCNMGLELRVLLMGLYMRGRMLMGIKKERGGLYIVMDRYSTEISFRMSYKATEYTNGPMAGSTVANSKIIV